MLNTPDSNSQKKLKDGIESVSEQLETSKEDFVSAAGNIKANIQSESERFQEDLKDLKEKVVDLSSTGISVQTNDFVQYRIGKGKSESGCALRYGPCRKKP